MVIHKTSPGKILSICALAFFLIRSMCTASAESVTAENIVIRYEVLVESCQLRTVIFDDEKRTIAALMPAVMAEKDSMVPLNVEVPIASVRVNPPWGPTPEMREDPDDRGMKPVKGGQPGNPLGRIALYPEFPDPEFKYIRIHEAPELPQRKLTLDESGNLRGYRESHGCVGLYLSDLVTIAARLTGLEEDEINKLVLSRKSKYLPVKYRATVIFLKE